MNSASLYDSAQKPTPSAKRLLQSLANFIDLVARCTEIRDFEQRFSHSEPLSKRQCIQFNSTRRNIFTRAPRRDSKFIQRFLVHQQDLAHASAPAMNTFLEPFIFDRKYLLKFLHRLAMRQALK